MRKISLLSALFFVCITVFLSCKKKDGINNGIQNKNRQPFDIMSTKVGSWWLYKADDGAVFYRYATGRDSFVAGLTYDYFYRIETTSVMKEPTPEYFGKNDGKYISLIDLNGEQKDYITYVILIDNSYQGQTWDNTENRKIQGWNLNLLIESEILSVTESLTLEGKTYTDVIHVHNDLKAKSVVMPSYVKCGTLEVWFKKGVGILKEDGDIDISPAGVSLLSKKYADHLVDYHIEP